MAIEPKIIEELIEIISQQNPKSWKKEDRHKDSLIEGFGKMVGNYALRLKKKNRFLSREENYSLFVHNLETHQFVGIEHSRLKNLYQMLETANPFNHLDKEERETETVIGLLEKLRSME